MSGGIKIPVNADFDGSDIDKVIAKLNEQMNRLAATIASANKVKFQPVDKGSLDTLKAMEQRFNELKKVSGGLRDRIKATGQKDTPFGEIDWGRMYEDPAMRARKMQQAFQHVTHGTGYAVGGPAPAAPGPANVPQRPAPAVNHTSGGGNGGSGGGFVPAIGQIAGAGLRATGPVGGVIANAGAAGMAGGMGAGVMGLLGGLAALAVGKGISAIKGKIDAAGQEGVGYDTLKRTLGDVNVSFNLLRSSLRAASKDIDVTFEEASRLGSGFARGAGMKRDDYKSLAEEVKVAGGFGRSFGVDPGNATDFFAQMRNTHATENTDGSRRMALMIGEAVGRSGQFSKMDEVLQAVGNYATSQTRAGLATANVSGYAGAFSGMMSSHIPGLDPTGIAALLGRVNGSIAGGGSAGEAGQNYMYSVLGRRNHLNPIDTALLQQQGAFGTGRGAFGSSVYKQFHGKFGGGVHGAAAESDTTNLSALLGDLQKKYSGNSSLMANATAQLFGINETQAMALHVAGPNRVNGMAGRMGRLGLDIGKLSGTGISALANIETGDAGTLRAQADALRTGSKPLTQAESSALDGAKTPEALKDILTQLTYSREQEQTEGSKTRESIQMLDKTMTEMATKMVGPTNDMRNALVMMAGGGKMGAGGIARAVYKAEHDEITGGGSAREAEINGRYGHQMVATAGRADAIQAEINRLLGSNDPASRAKIKQLQAERNAVHRNAPGMMGKLKAQRDAELALSRADMQSRLAALGAGPDAGPVATPDDALYRELARTDRELGLAPGTSAAQMRQESHFDPYAVSKKGAMGMAQVMPGTLHNLEKKFGRKINPWTEGPFIQREIMRENKARFGTDAGALAAYNSGWDPNKWGNDETVDYLSKIGRSRGMFATGMPGGAAAGAGHDAGAQHVPIVVSVTLQGKDGQQLAPVQMIPKKIAVPKASGATG